MIELSTTSGRATARNFLGGVRRSLACNACRELGGSYDARESPRLSGFFPGADESVERDVEIAEDRQEEGVMDTDAVGEQALEFGDDSASDDRRDQQAGAIAGERAESFDGQRE